MLKDIRESFQADLKNPDFQRAFITAAYEEEGNEGVIRALGEIAAAKEQTIDTLKQNDNFPLSTSRSLRKSRNPAFKSVRAALNAIDLDLAIVAKK